MDTISKDILLLRRVYQIIFMLLWKQKQMFEKAKYLSVPKGLREQKYSYLLFLFIRSNTFVSKHTKLSLLFCVRPDSY